MYLVSLKGDQTFNTGHQFVDGDDFVGGIHQFPCRDRDIVALSGRFLGNLKAVEMDEDKMFFVGLDNEFELIVLGPLMRFVE
jgi:hypothetical protein